MKTWAFLFLIFLLVCVNKQKGSPAYVTVNTRQDSTATNSSDPTTEIIEIFSDSTNIGEKGKCKIEVIKHRVFNNMYVIVKFYTKGPSFWNIQNTYLYECDAFLDLMPDISDFNNDQLNDITFISATAARGANEVRRLFIYDAQKRELVSIVNSQDYPNMLYNKELDCIDSWAIYGGCSTTFLKIRGDSLIKFASVDVSDSLFVSEYNNDGKENVIFKNRVGEDLFVRYKNYKPLKEYSFDINSEK